MLCPDDVVPVTSTITPPRSTIGSDDAPSILDWRGRMESLWIPKSVNRDSGPTTIMAPVSITDGVLVDLVGLFNLLVKVGNVRPS